MAENRDGSGRGGQIERKRENATDSGDGARDLSSINGASVPGICCGVGDAFEHELGRNTTIGGGDGDGFVENLKESFDSQGFMIAAGDAMVTDLEDFGHGDEITFKLAVVVDDNQAAETNFQEDLLHE